MPVQSNLTLNTKVYAPRGKTSGDIAKWALVGDATFGGASSIVTERVIGPSKEGVNRVTFKLTVPKAAAADTSCACVGEEIARGLVNIEVIIPSAFTAAERDDFRLRIQGLISSTVFASAVKDLEGSW